MTSHTLREIAGNLAVSLRTVQSWITDGSLRAVNVSRSRTSRKPRLRVLDPDLATFLATRTVGGPAPKPSRRRLPTTSKEYV